MMQVGCSAAGRINMQPARGSKGSHGVRQALPEARTKRRYIFASIVTSCGLLLAKGGQAAQVFTPEVDPETSPLIQELLKRTEENKEKRKRELLDAYNRRNFQDYFGFEQDSPGLSPATRERIKEWLKSNQDN